MLLKYSDKHKKFGLF